MDRLKIISLSLILLLIFVVFVVIPGYKLSAFFYKPMLTANSKPIVVDITKLNSASAYVTLLKENGYIDSPRWVLKFLELKRMTKKIQSGIYRIQPGESAYNFTKRVVAGDVIKEQFAIIPGTTFSQVINKLQITPFIQNDVSLQNLQDNFSNPEGTLLADTYIYHAGSKGMELLLLAQKNLTAYLNVAWDKRCADTPWKSPYEMLIAASIIEKEAANSQERRLIAGVMVNRLKKNMRLQMDPTVIYALKDKYQGKIYKEDLKINSPYNTYLYKGLPPTPIAIVGKDAIDAASCPLKTDYLYFVAKGDKTHHFSVTYEEQKRAITLYQSGH